MQTRPVQSWEEFESEIQQLIQYRNELETDLKKPDNWIFRGHCDSTWHLETTLERETEKELYSIQKYFKIIKQAKSKIEAVYELSLINWETLDSPQYADWYRNSNFLYLQGLLSYMIYLRHHGFPSPLLDWTKSIDVAAYFAFQNIKQDVKSVSIFAFLNHTAGTKGGWLAEPNISKIKPPLNLEDTLDKRHVSQKGSYTYCSIETQQEYSNHEKVFSANRRHKFPQDVLWKFEIPVSERDKVIRILESKNINTSSLFDSQFPIEEAEFFKKIFIELDNLES